MWRSCVAVKRSRDTLSSLSPTQESAPKKADQRSSINADTPRSPSPEPYAEITLNSTAYAALAVEAGERREHYLSSSPTLSPIKAYAAVAASPPRLKSQLQDNERKISLGPPSAVTGTDAVMTTGQSDIAADAGATTQGVRGYPPLVAAARRDSHITWFCHAPVTERPTKIGIRGLPVDAAPDAIITALQELKFPAEYVRPILPRKGRPGCLFYARLWHTNQDELQRSGIHRQIATDRSDAYAAVKVTWRPIARGPVTKNLRVQSAKTLTRRATKDLQPLQGKFSKEGSRSPPPPTNRTESHHLTSAASSGTGRGRGSPIRCDRPLHNVPDNGRPTGRRTGTRAVNSSTGAASELARQARAGHSNQGTESVETQYGRKANREAEEMKNRSITTPASPASNRRPANAPTYTRLPRIRTRSSDNDDGATSDTIGAANATDSSYAAPGDAADPPATSGNATDRPTNLCTPPDPGEPRLPTTGATHLDTGVGDGGLSGDTNRPGSGHGAATGITSRSRRTPADLRIAYWNAGGVSGKMPDLRTLVQSQDIHIVLGRAKRQPGAALFWLERVIARGINFRAPRYWSEETSSTEDWSSRTSPILYQ
ncbi:hypothetical protein EVAR_19784_1 [Eumeta japonica]|uniref:Uncharacterized protein n=1 Tax=Eumeta variegata TaxID=151549 RepID=A0A4C1URY9_EUMVA|nr:hypothetical protein EVAR_19784_1 [Eumeta japonica]